MLGTLGKQRGFQALQRPNGSYWEAPFGPGGPYDVKSNVWVRPGVAAASTPRFGP